MEKLGHLFNPQNVYYIWRRAHWLEGDLTGGGQDDKAALEDHDRLVKLEPESASTYLERSEILTALGQLDAAQADIKRANQLAPGGAAKERLDTFTKYAATVQTVASIDCMSAKSQIDGEKAYRHRVVWSCSRAINLQKLKAMNVETLSGFYFLRGAANYKDNRFDEALVDFSELVRLTPKDADAYLWRAMTFAAKGNHQAVVTVCTERIKLLPTAPECYSMRAAAYEGLGRREEAKADYLMAVKIAPDNKAAQAGLEQFFQAPRTDLQSFDLGDCAPDSKEFARALAACSLVVNQGGSNEKLAYAYFARGAILLAQNDFAGALGEFD